MRLGEGDKPEGQLPSSLGPSFIWLRPWKTEGVRGGELGPLGKARKTEDVNWSPNFHLEIHFPLVFSDTCAPASVRRPTCTSGIEQLDTCCCCAAAGRQSREGGGQLSAPEETPPGPLFKGPFHTTPTPNAPGGQRRSAGAPPSLLCRGGASSTRRSPKSRGAVESIDNGCKRLPTQRWRFLKERFASGAFLGGGATSAVMSSLRWLLVPRA